MAWRRNVSCKQDLKSIKVSYIALLSPKGSSLVHQTTPRLAAASAGVHPAASQLPCREQDNRHRLAKSQLGKLAGLLPEEGDGLLLTVDV
jgi:hypothetical protein